MIQAKYFFFFVLVSSLLSSPPNTSQEPTGGRVYKRWDGEGEGGTLRKGDSVHINKRAEHVIGTEYEREGGVEITCRTFIYFLVALSPLQTNYRGRSAEVTWGHRWGLFLCRIGRGSEGGHMWIKKYVVSSGKKSVKKVRHNKVFYHYGQLDQAHRHLLSFWLSAQGADCL